MGFTETPLAGSWPAPAVPPVDPQKRRRQRALGLGLVARVRAGEGGEPRCALQISEAVVVASSNLVFAKDRGGRSLLLNRAAALACAQPPGAAIGRDDRALFPPAQAALLAAAGQGPRYPSAAGAGGDATPPGAADV